MDNWYELLIEYFKKVNIIPPKQAIIPEFANKRIFEEPILGCSDPRDDMFVNLKTNVIGEHFRLPNEWNPLAQSVVSLFFPFTEEIIKSNAQDREYPSDLWLHGRIEGQSCLNETGRFLVNLFESNGYQTVCPCISNEFFAVEKGEKLSFTSNWSERHVAFISGLGTFGLSKGIITEKGMAGRLLSIITQADIKKTNKTYTDIYENCTMCNACSKVCPANAICLETGKDHVLCSNFIDITKEKSKPRYGCGKCQVLVPCARRIPRKISNF